MAYFLTNQAPFPPPFSFLPFRYDLVTSGTIRGHPKTVFCVLQKDCDFRWSSQFIVMHLNPPLISFPMVIFSLFKCSSKDCTHPYPNYPSPGNIDATPPSLGGTPISQSPDLGLHRGSIYTFSFSPVSE